jgi:hypothetical protein
LFDLFFRLAGKYPSLPDTSSRQISKKYLKEIQKVKDEILQPGHFLEFPSTLTIKRRMELAFGEQGNRCVVTTRHDLLRSAEVVRSHYASRHQQVLRENGYLSKVEGRTLRDRLILTQQLDQEDVN